MFQFFKVHVTSMVTRIRTKASLTFVTINVRVFSKNYNFVGQLSNNKIHENWYSINIDENQCIWSLQYLKFEVIHVKQDRSICKSKLHYILVRQGSTIHSASLQLTLACEDEVIYNKGWGVASNNFYLMMTEKSTAL